MPGPPPLIPLAQLTATCERFYARDGFVKWAEVGDALGISRQAVQTRLKKAVDRGDLSPEDVNRWQSIASRRAASRQNEEQRRGIAQRTITATLSPENAQWLRVEAAVRKLRAEDILDGLVTKARNAVPEDVREG